MYNNMNHLDDDAVLGLKLYAEGQHRKAERVFQKCLRRKNKGNIYRLTIQNALETAYFMQRKYNEAERELSATLLAM
jgi:tetratricopeptide (TPR) repeat protein